MRATAFRAEVLFGLAREPAWPRVSDILATLYPGEQSAAHIEIQRGGHAVLRFGKVAVEATYLKLPSPEPAAAGVAHDVHVVLYAEAKAGPGAAAEPTLEERLRLARAVTMVAGALSLRKDCAGVIWSAAPRLLETEAFRRAAARLAKGRDPQTVWVDVLREAPPGRAQAARGAALARTVGLAAFFGHEVEIEAGPEDLETQTLVLRGLVEHVFAEGRLVEDGAAFRIEGAGEFVARMTRSQVTGGGQVCLLQRLRPEPVAEDPAPAAPPAAPAPAPAPAPHPAAGPVPGASPAAEPAAAGPVAAEEPGAASEPAICSAVILFEPADLPDAMALSRAVVRLARRLGTAPELDATDPDRLVLDWGTIRGLGRRQNEVVLRGWSMPEAFRDWIAAENPAVLRREPDILSRSRDVLLRDVPGRPGERTGVSVAMLLATVASAIVGLPGVRGIVWPASGVLLDRETAQADFRRMGVELPLGLCVATRLVGDSEGRRWFITRGLADLGEPEVMMSVEAGDERAQRGTFEALVRGLLYRNLSRRGARFVNAIDGAEFELAEEAVEGLGTVLKARLVRPPKRSGGLTRLLRLRD